MKATYRVTINDVLPKGDNVRTKEWTIYAGGVRVGSMSSRITLLHWNPTNYNVFVAAYVDGDQVFAIQSRGFVTTMREAHWERTSFVNRAKEAIARRLSQMGARSHYKTT
jgi:hypothetical protein